MIAGIILASGLSKRFGKNKLLLPFGEQRLIEHVIDQVKLSRLREIYLVYGQREQEFLNIGKKKKVSLIYNPNFSMGQSEAVKKGVQVLAGRARGILFFLGDQPFVNPCTINRMLACFDDHPDAIILPMYRGSRGNPVLFSQRFFDEMLELKGDQGARSIIQRYPQHLIPIPIENGMELLDIDDQGDYYKALNWMDKMVRGKHKSRFSSEV